MPKFNFFTILRNSLNSKFEVGRIDPTILVKA